jgi:hypothetical protein
MPSGRHRETMTKTLRPLVANGDGLKGARRLRMAWSDKPDRVFVDVEDDRDRRGCFGRQRSGVSDADEHDDLSARQFSHQLRQSIDLILGPAIYDRHVLAFVR